MAFIPKNPEPYDPCYCKSGKKYKFCHFPIDRASGIERLKLSQDSYFQKWSSNSFNFERQGAYEWMAKITARAKPARILDIGCGSGLGILSLLKNCSDIKKLITVDDLKQCLLDAHNRCRDGGFNGQVITRYEERAEAKVHELTLVSQNFSFDERLSFVQGDLLWDEALIQKLNVAGPFDAITCWLIGTYDNKGECLNIKSTRAFSEVGLYRWKVQENLYEMAVHLLRSDGILHFVDRGINHDTALLIESSKAEHADHIGMRPLKLIGCEILPYSETQSHEGIKMERAFSGSNTFVPKSELALVSVLVEKI